MRDACEDVIEGNEFDDGLDEYDDSDESPVIVDGMSEKSVRALIELLEDDPVSDIHAVHMCYTPVPYTCVHYSNELARSLRASRTRPPIATVARPSPAYGRRSLRGWRLDERYEEMVETGRGRLHIHTQTSLHVLMAF